MTKQSRFEFYQQSSLSQRLAHKHKEFSQYAGSDPQISEAIAFLNVLEKFGIVDTEDLGYQLLKATLNEQRKARFATSPHVNEISKMGMMLPAREAIFRDE